MILEPLGIGGMQPATVQLLHTSQRLTSGPETGYGLGWDVETVTPPVTRRRRFATTASRWAG